MEYEPVTHSSTERSLARLPSGRAVEATVHRYVGGDGPVVHVQAAQHGIELNGPAALRRVHERLLDASLAGTVVVVPVVNRPAFDNRSYITPAALDARNPNLNRVWPGDESGTLQERMAASLWELVTESDVTVDLHTGTPDMLEHVRFQQGDDDARALAEVFGTEYLLANDADTDAEGTFRGKFRTAAARADIPAVTVELSNSRSVKRAAVETGVTGFLNLLRHLDALDERPTDPPEQTLLVDDGEKPRATSSGLFELRPDLTVGDHVPAGAELGTVYGPSSYEKLQTVTTDDAGTAYSLTRESVVMAGERVGALATRADGAESREK